MESELVSRFIRYAKIDTQSSEESGAHPSTSKQRDLAKLLVQELREMGVPEVDYDEEHCYVYAYLPGNAGEGKGAGDNSSDDEGAETDTMKDESKADRAIGQNAALDDIGFIAHLDTSPAVTGKDVNPVIIQFDGNDEVLKIKDFPELSNHIGEELIRTDGTTLLGADDKAGIAEIMEMLSYYISDKTRKHRGIAVAFTPDEEIGEGTGFFDIDRFHAKQAYTVDGGKFGIIEYECFNAASATVTIKGRSVHPGSGKGQLVNAALIATEFASLMPDDETPEHTEGYEGFYYLDSIEGGCESATLQYLIRDHDEAKFEARKAFMRNAADTINTRHGDGTCTIEIKDQYPNMAVYLKDHMDMIDRAMNAIKSVGGTPSSEPVRGGTDGAVLSSRGLPCPNLCTGGYNYHSRFEYASVPEMKKSLEVLISLSRAF